MKSLLALGSRPLFSGVAMLLLLLSCNGESPTAPLAQPPQPAPPVATGVVSGTVFDASGACLPGAVVEVLDGARAGDRLTQNECSSWNWHGEGVYSISLACADRL